jgi:GR25 family glycosyltransferase involved in LPS biosynthesis
MNMLVQLFMVVAVSIAADSDMSCRNLLKHRVSNECNSIRFRSSLSHNEFKSICLSCEQNPCHFMMLLNWTSMASDNGRTYDDDDNDTEAFNKYIEHVYVVHYSKRVNRRQMMTQRLERSGLFSPPDIISYVDKFDYPEWFDSYSPSSTECFASRGHSIGGPFSVAMKHYAAYYDMLRQGYRYSLIIEDDASFKSGSKVITSRTITAKSTKRKQMVLNFDVVSTFKVDNATSSLGFKETMNEIIGPDLDALPWLHSPTSSEKNSSDKERVNDGHQHTSSKFDLLQLGACDRHWLHYKGGVDIESGRSQYQSKPITQHLSTNSCSRCGLAYIISERGAVKLLSSIGQQLHSTSPFKDHLHPYPQRFSPSSSSTETPSLVGNMNCIWVEPPIVWEDPGKTMNGLALKEERK